MRPIANGRRHRPVGNFFSVKSGRMQAWESRLELHGLWRAEACGEILESRVQPVRLEVRLDAREFFYTPDRKDVLADGSVEIIEVKDEFEAEKDPLYLSKLNLAATIFATLGWSFRIEERAQIEAEPAFSAIRTIQHYARTAITAADVIAVHNLFDGRRTVSLEEAQTALGAGVRGFAAVCALIVRRLLSVSPSDGLT